MREIPFRQRPQRKPIEEDPSARERTIAAFSPPAGAPLAFREGYRECVVLYALHAPNKRGVARILDEHCVLLEQACLASEMNRDDVARYEGFRQAIKDLRAARRVRS